MRKEQDWGPGLNSGHLTLVSILVSVGRLPCGGRKSHLHQRDLRHNYLSRSSWFAQDFPGVRAESPASQEISRSWANLGGSSLSMPLGPIFFQLSLRASRTLRVILSGSHAMLDPLPLCPCDVVYPPLLLLLQRSETHTCPSQPLLFDRADSEC